MKKANREDHNPASLDEFIAEITVAAHDDNEKLHAFRQFFRDNVTVPCDAFVIGGPVSVIGFDYDGNVRRGLTALCRREDGSEHVVAAYEINLSPRSYGTRCLAAYRKWMGLEPHQIDIAAAARNKYRHKASSIDLDLRGLIELVALAVNGQSAHCRLLKSDRVITLRVSQIWGIVPGEIVTVKPKKQWSYAGHPYLSGEIQSTRIDTGALGLAPLRLEDQGVWLPKEHYSGGEGEPIEEWVKPIIAFGPRPIFEMEQVLPGQNLDDPDSDPICASNNLKDTGDHKGACKILMDLCKADLRCLDAHAHLGHFIFDHWAEEALRHYEAGFRIGGLSFNEDFEGLLPWDHIDNRPFLQCMHGFGLCLWRLGRFEEADRIFDRMLWLNPSDHQGVRFLIDDVQKRTPWEDRREEGQE